MIVNGIGVNDNRARSAASAIRLFDDSDDSDDSTIVPHMRLVEKSSNSRMVEWSKRGPRS